MRKTTMKLEMTMRMTMLEENRDEFKRLWIYAGHGNGT